MALTDCWAGRFVLDLLAYFGLEWLVGFRLECMAVFAGIRNSPELPPPGGERNSSIGLLDVPLFLTQEEHFAVLIFPIEDVGERNTDAKSSCRMFALTSNFIYELAAITVCV